MGKHHVMDKLEKRYLTAQTLQDLERKMVFVAGPRQVGKTTLARRIPGAREGYLNWDVAEDRERILRRELPRSPLWVFDEIHKYTEWRGYLKGLWDSRESRKPAGEQILVTGSARLDYYRYSGDSLQGRYHLLRLHPLSVAELGLETSEDFAQLLTLGGFPEPFFSGSETEARRWSREYRQRLLYEEVTSLENVQDLGRLELLMLRLPDLVAAPLSINALREDLQLAHQTVASWIDILERLYGIFRISPFGAPQIRAIKKAQKHYHFDWTLVREPPQRFENLVACALFKWIHYEQDVHGRGLELRYFRDTDGREVDFVVTEDRRPLRLIECKQSDTRVDKNLRYLAKRFPEAEAWQISAEGVRDAVTPEGIRLSPGLSFLRELV